eukprot:989354_1
MADHQAQLNAMKGTIRKWTDASEWDDGRFIVVPSDAEFSCELDGRYKVRVAFVNVNGGKQMIRKHFVRSLHVDSEAIRQLRVTANKITDGSFKYVKGNVIDFNSPKFQEYRQTILLDAKGVKPFTVDLRKCKTQHEKKEQFRLKLFQLPNHAYRAQ